MEAGRGGQGAAELLTEPRRGDLSLCPLGRSLRLARRPPGWADPKQKGVQEGMGAHDVAQPGSRRTHGFGGTPGTCSCHLWETPEGIWGTLGHEGSCTSAFCRGDGHQAAWGRGLAVPGLTPQSPAPTAVGLIRSRYLPGPPAGDLGAVHFATNHPGAGSLFTFPTSLLRLPRARR